MKVSAVAKILDENGGKDLIEGCFPGDSQPFYPKVHHPYSEAEPKLKVATPE